jgi:hypothetical protein
MIRTRKILPDAHIERIADGVLSRPDLTAAVVRRVTGVAERGGVAASEASEQPV